MSSYVPATDLRSKTESTPAQSFYSPPGLTLGRFLFILVSLFVSIGPFVADFNETHVYNPNWPPHARFHNGQTMTSGLLLGLATIFFAFRPIFSSRTEPSTWSDETLKASAEAQLDWEENDALAAAITGCLYTGAALTGPFYPGAAGVDPEFGSGFPQLVPFVAAFLVAWIGYVFEIMRINNQRLSLTAKVGKWD